MGSISLEKVQKLLHLDVEYPYFDSYEQSFEFSIDSVTVKAIAFVKWRSIKIDIIEPFQIEAWSFCPTLISLKVIAIRRREVLKNLGISDTEDFISKTKIAYHRHVVTDRHIGSIP